VKCRRESKTANAVSAGKVIFGDDITSLKRAGTYRPWEHPVL